MASTIINIIFGILPETLYFTLFIIYSKKLKEKRILLFLLMFGEYVLLKIFIKFDVTFQIIYTFMTFLILKILYKEKVIVTDIFMFTLSSIILIIISFISYMMIYCTLKIYIISYIINRILLFGILFLCKNKINIMYKKLNNIWNRNNKHKIRSLTVRNISVIIFNLMFYIINFGMLYFINFLKK